MSKVSAAAQSLNVDGLKVAITHPDKIVFPKDLFSKGEMIRYYADVASAMVPHLANRPISMERFPDGIEGPRIFHKDAPAYFPSWIRRVPIEKKDGHLNQVVCNDRATLLYLANQGCITPHLWLSKENAIHRPDKMIFDLDPSDDKQFVKACKTAHVFRGFLDELELPSYPMLTGSRGIHVMVPIKPEHDFEVVRDFARRLAEALVRTHPEEWTLESRIAARGGRLFLDVLRNAYAQTAVAPYALRPLDGMPVATPLKWDELDGCHLSSQAFNVNTVRKRLEKIGDPWAQVYKRPVSLARVLKRSIPAAPTAVATVPLRKSHGKSKT